jgi:hypothetical protein
MNWKILSHKKKRENEFTIYSILRSEIKIESELESKIESNLIENSSSDTS